MGDAPGLKFKTAGGGRSGVAMSSTFTEEIGKGEDLLQRDEDWKRTLRDLVEGQRGLLKLLRSIDSRQKPLRNRFDFKEFTCVSGDPVLRQEGVKLDCRTIFGGVPAFGWKIIVSTAAVVGLQVNINGTGWQLSPGTSNAANAIVSQGDEVIETIAIRVGTAGTGIVQLILTAADVDQFRMS